MFPLVNFLSLLLINALINLNILLNTKLFLICHWIL